MITNWGYEIDHLEDVLTVTEFDSLTAGRFAGDQRVRPTLSAAVSAMRNYCGWHVFPSAECTYHARALDRRLIFVGSDILVQLPACFVSAVHKVKIDGVEVDDFSFEVGGLLRIYDVCVTSRKTVIDVEYTAGLPDELAGGVKEIVAGRVSHGLSQSYGVQSEAAGGVSVTYSASWLNSAQAGALQDASKEALEPYRLQGVF